MLDLRSAVLDSQVAARSWDGIFSKRMQGIKSLQHVATVWWFGICWNLDLFHPIWQLGTIPHIAPGVLHALWQCSILLRIRMDSLFCWALNIQRTDSKFQPDNETALRYYDILEVTPKAKKEDIKEAWPDGFDAAARVRVLSTEKLDLKATT